ncbi:hypothetical protein SDC9_133374 [bioreactor metagenome]|uniref:Uncharacterized protein n=1 Tax=bioreactor metagenome TaxID=1076179 RepID=A0A645DAM3_9ZZZZ
MVFHLRLTPCGIVGQRPGAGHRHAIGAQRLRKVMRRPLRRKPNLQHRVVHIRHVAKRRAVLCKMRRRNDGSRRHKPAAAANHILRGDVPILRIRCQRANPVFLRVDQICRADAERALRVRFHVGNLLLQFERICPVVVPFADGNVFAPCQRKDVVF